MRDSPALRSYATAMGWASPVRMNWGKPRSSVVATGKPLRKVSSRTPESISRLRTLAGSYSEPSSPKSRVMGGTATDLVGISTRRWLIVRVTKTTFESVA